MEGVAESLYLIKVGEIALKGENRSYFEAKLRQNIRRKLKGVGSLAITGGSGRFTLRAPRSADRAIREALSTTFGITSFSPTLRTAKEIDEIKMAALELTGAIEPELLAQSFKVDARRSDKSFPFRSYDLASLLGRHLLDRFPTLSVDVHRPRWTLNVEIREKAFLYIDRREGPGGLPVGCAGRGMLLLSGGIDSPVAGYLMAKRGLHLDAVYFHTYPYTSPQAEDKVKSLARILAPYLGGINLLVVPFTECQMRIRERAPAEETTLLMRACMMKIAEMLAERRRAASLVTGEALSQVASQTPESIHFTGSVTSLPVFRPLIGFDKEEIIAVARRIGTFETSILPYDDCCALFAPKHPLIRPEFARMRDSFSRLAIEPLLAEAVGRAERSFFAASQTVAEAGDAPAQEAPAP